MKGLGVLVVGSAATEQPSICRKHDSNSSALVRGPPFTEADMTVLRRHEEGEMKRADSGLDRLHYSKPCMRLQFQFQTNHGRNKGLESKG